MFLVNAHAEDFRNKNFNNHVLHIYIEPRGDKHHPVQGIMSTPSLHIILFAGLVSLFVSAGCADQSRKDVALFIFGDSLIDAGTNNYINTTANYRANFPPYGETFFRYPTGRFSDGRLIVDFIAEYAKLPLIPPYLQMKDGEFMGGVNFASGGAGALVESHAGYVVDLKTQLKQLEQLEKKLRKEMGSEKAKSIIKEGVYLISIGTNDYVPPLLYNTALFHSISMEDYVGMVIGNITTVLQGIHKVGGRKFAMIGISLLGCAPGMRSLTRNGACSDDANKLAKLHNVALISILTKLEAQLQGFKYSYFDFYASTQDRIQYPSKYGFKEAETACCGSGPYRGNTSCGGKGGAKEYLLCRRPEKYVFFDNYHPSDRANQQLAQLMWNGNLSVIRPHNIEALFKYKHV